MADLDYLEIGRLLQLGISTLIDTNITSSVAYQVMFGI